MRFFKRDSLQSLVKELSTVYESTPDLGILESREHHLLFEYGEPIKQQSVSFAVTVSRMVMWTKRKEEKSDPITAIALRSSKDIPRARVGGTLYLVRTNLLVALDNLRQNGVCFKRERIPIFTPFLTPAAQLNQHRRGDDWLQRNEAWSYVGLSSFWNKAMSWDLTYYRGHGLFRVADINHHANRQLQIPHHFKYTVPEECYAVRRAHHMRTFKEQELQHAKEKTEQETHARAELFKPVVPPEPRKFIYITSTSSNEPSE